MEETVAGHDAPVLRHVVCGALQACRGSGGGGGVVAAVAELACFLSCPTWRWTSSCDRAATSYAVLYRSSFSTLLSFSPPTECVFPRCEQRQVPTAVPVLGPGCFLAQVVQRQVPLRSSRS